jgi:hypothetical protein
VHYLPRRNAPDSQHISNRSLDAQWKQQVMPIAGPIAEPQFARRAFGGVFGSRFERIGKEIETASAATTKPAVALIPATPAQTPDGWHTARSQLRNRQGG